MATVHAQLSGRFLDLYRSLLVMDVERDLPLESHKGILQNDLAYLLTVATRLALNSDPDSTVQAALCRYAYEIAVRSPNFANGSSQQVVQMSELILSRLGNFPARKLLRSRHQFADSLKSPFFAIEELVREAENSHSQLPQSYSLTDFQIRLLNTLRTKSFVSVSAPTSAGKSFTLGLDLVRRVGEAVKFIAVYLVPTRALIRQVTLDLIDLFRSHHLQASVLSTISPPVSEGTDDAASKLVFVLTQERFAVLLAEAGVDFQIDLIVVDEAQALGEETRGLTLERVLHRAIRRNPLTSLFFSSPLRSNPAFLLETFHKSQYAESFIEYRTPVTQNLVAIRPVQGKPLMARFELISDDQNRLIGEVLLPFKFRNSYIGQLAKYLTKDSDTSIIYCNRPSSADRMAEEITESMDPSTDETLTDFAKFLRQEVHPRYRLAKFVLRETAFHYSNIPQIVRGRIEQLVKTKKIRFVCCTSTLLQGMNLPAKNMFVENPKTGTGEDGQISRGDFWNLVGRAGRLTQEFTGNVFCVFGKEWDNSNLLAEDQLMPIESAFHVAVVQRTKELEYLSRELPKSAESGSAWAEQAFAGIFADRLENDTRLSDSVQDEALSEMLNAIDTTAAQIEERRTLPVAVFTSNFYVHPQRLEELAELFRSKSSLQEFVPSYPSSSSGYQTTVRIFGIIEDVFIKSDTKRHTYFALLAVWWMKGQPIRELIRSRLKYNETPDEEEDVNNEIRKLFKEIEEEIRFKYVKYVGLYLRVLDAVLREKGLAKQADKLLPLNVFLEFGASNQTLINLMSLGLSRTTALKLKDEVSLNDDVDVSKCREYLRSVNLQFLSLPKLCLDEISRLR